MSTESNTYALSGTSPEAVMRRVDEAICAFDDDWRVTFVNDQAATMLEHSPEELLGCDIWTVVPTLDETVVGDQLQEAMATGTPARFERYNEERDRWFEIRIYPDDGGATACFYEITDERSDELGSQCQHRLFDTVFRETGDALIVTDTDRRITEFNNAAEQLFGYDASEVIGEATRLLYADADEYDRQGNQRFNEDAPICQEAYQVRYERADGTTFIGESLQTSLEGSNEGTAAFLESIRDASARSEYGQTLEAYNDTLQTFHDISTDDDRSADERIDAVLELGCEHLGLDVGILSVIEGTDYTVEQVGAPEDSIQPGEQFDLGETFCDCVVDTEELVAVTDVGNSELADHRAYETQELESYIGTTVIVDGEQYGTLNFSQAAPRKQPFAESERTLVRLFAQLVGKELSRQQNKQRAAANRDRLRQIIDLLPQLVFAKDRSNEFILANQAVADAYGTTVEDVEGSTDADFVSSAAEAEQFRQDNLAVIDSGEPKHIPEEPLTKANGETATLQTIKIPYDPVDHDMEAVLGVATDITKQKRLESSLRESQQSLQELTSIASDTDRGVEDKLRALLELGAERLGLPYGFLNRIDNDTQHVVQAVGDHPELQTGASAPKEKTYCRKTTEQSTPLSIQNAVDEGWEGDPAYKRFDLGCYIGGSVTVDGNLYGTLCFADRQHRDHEFTDAERTFVELLVQWISHELSRSSVETKLRQINETGQQFMSVPSKEQVASLAIESAESIVDVSAVGLWWYDDDRDALVPEQMTEAAAEYVSEQPVCKRGTALAWEAFDAGEVQVYDNLGAVNGIYNEQTAFNSEIIVPLGSHGILCAGSVDHQSFSETEISLLEVLSSTVESALTRAERETQLRETQAALKQSNEELEQFAYAASHDLQEPLRTVSSYLTLLERRYSDDLDGDATKFIEFAVDGADRMKDMIQALLAYSRVDTRGESFEAVNLLTIFERVTDSLGVKIAETDATVSMPSTAATVKGDPSQLARLFQNLVDNAIKYNTGQPTVDISAHHHDGTVSIQVTDNGIGMDPDQIDGIFEVFQRLHTREEFEGTGIGLSICQKIVDRHGGDIEVESQRGEGSTFTITLPEGVVDV